MDRITEKLLTEFIGEYGLEDETQDTSFEHFVNLVVVSRDYQESFDPREVHVGGQSNPGIDGLAIIVNGALVDELEEIDDLLHTNNNLEVSFIFTQAKTSSSFDGGDIGTFIEAVRDFFREQPLSIRGEDLARRAEISEYIFEKSSKMRMNPTCHLYFVTTGTWNGDPHLQGRLDSGRADLEATQLFSSVRTEAFGAKDLQNYYRHCKDTISVEIDFPNKVTLPTIEGVQQAFVGILPAEVFFKLIVDDTGNLRRSVFEDNIRDFQGDTNVNDAIKHTLSGNSSSQTFVVFNNGITIVCRGLQLTGNKCVLTGFQIVNGCQTSNVLFNARNTFDATKVLIPIKLVSTENEELVNDIIRSTNSQNAVKPEELEAMTDFQKRLELFYRSFSGDDQLYYERRSRQWMASTVHKTRIVTIPSQIKAVAAMFLNVPHRVSGYYGTVRTRMQNQIFRSDHKLLPYYVSSFALFRLDSLFRSGTIDQQHKRLRWFLLLLFRCKIGGQPPALSSNAIDRYCEKILDTLRSPSRTSAVFESIIGTLNSHQLPAVDKESVKTQALRDALLGAIGTPLHDSGAS